MELLGTISGGALAIAVMAVVLRHPALVAVRGLVPWLIGARLLGATARYLIITVYYDGMGDAIRYSSVGALYRSDFLAGDFSALSPDVWTGTLALELTTAILGIPALGSTLGTFYLFSSFGLIGLAAIGVAARSAFPSLPARPILVFLFLWPTLLFWPSSIGKESVMTLAVGLVTLGMARVGRRRWQLLALGLLVAFAIRPHVAALLAVSLFVADTLQTRRRGPAKWFRLSLSGALAVWLVLRGATVLGIEEPSFDSMMEEIQYRSDNTDRGGSSLGQRQAGIAAIPIGLFNVFFRPLPFEARNAMMLLAALETAALWALVYRRRREAWRILKGWRASPLLTFSVIYAVTYAALIGVTFVNMGILARQRSLMMPMVVLVLGMAYAEVSPRRRRPTRTTRLGRHR